jgi:hypothetical protein
LTFNSSPTLPTGLALTFNSSPRLPTVLGQQPRRRAGLGPVAALGRGKGGLGHGTLRLERRSDNVPLAEARGRDLPWKRLLKPAPVEGGRAPFVPVRTEGEPGTEGAGFNL